MLNNQTVTGILQSFLLTNMIQVIVRALDILEFVAQHGNAGN
jgi:hypothetical protein